MKFISILLSVWCTLLCESLQTRASTTTQLPLPRCPQYSHVQPFPEICGNQSIAFPSKIMGGSEAILSEFPWMARIRHRSPSGLHTYGCAGFLISEYFVLTAAHCIASKAFLSLGPIDAVQLGEHNTEDDQDCEIRGSNEWCADFPQVIKTGKPKLHPEYTGNGPYHNDIALLPLKQAVEFTQFVYPICLATRLSEQSEMWLAGWGRTENGTPSPIKLKVTVRRASRNDCVPLYGNINVTILDSQICAGGEGGKDSCSGDSGGPLMVLDGINTWYAEGIVSFGNHCGLQGWPGVYTNIPYHMPWITRTIMGHYTNRRADMRQVTRY